jgi:hypothetical protein
MVKMLAVIAPDWQVHSVTFSEDDSVVVRVMNDDGTEIRAHD